MALFDNYENLGNAIPNNLYARYPVKEIYKRPYEQYNAQGEFVGYFWNYGTTVNLQFDLSGEITVEGNAIIYTVAYQKPTKATKGFIGQKAYNIVDLTSWTLDNIVGEDYNWIEDSEFQYPVEGSKNIYIDATDYLKDKKVIVSLYDFRMEKIDERLFEGNTNIVYIIDKELSDKLVKGIYYCSLVIYDPVALTYITVIDNNSFLLEVK